MTFLIICFDSLDFPELKLDESQTSSSKHPQESNVNLGTAEASGSEVVNDLNSAKVAAMKAAELGKRLFPLQLTLFCNMVNCLTFNDRFVY